MIPGTTLLAGVVARLAEVDTLPLVGRVTRAVGPVIESAGPRAAVGSVCEVVPRSGPPLSVEVVGFRDSTTLTLPLGKTSGIERGDRVVARGGVATVPVGPSLLGRVVDGLGRPLDGRPLRAVGRYPLHAAPLNPLAREPVTQPLGTGVRTIDGLLTCGRGQRLGLFGGSGVGKSTLLGMLTRGTAADVVVLGLVGEGGREVRTFLDRDLGEAGLARAVVVVSTSDNPPLARMRAAHSATAIAEYFRDQGMHVLLLIDSVTRYAAALREVGLAAGEPSTTTGDSPSVFARLPSLLESAGGVRNRGSITAIYTVLLDGDHHLEPSAASVRSILDGHVVLSRALADRHHYPAIDVLQSVSRTMPDVAGAAHREQAARVRGWLADIRDSEDLVSVGAYVQGANARVDEARARAGAIESFLRQPAGILCGLSDSVDELMKL